MKSCFPEVTGASVFGIRFPGDGLVQAFHEPAEAAEALPIHGNGGTDCVLLDGGQGLAGGIALD